MTTEVLGSVTYSETPTVNGTAVQLAGTALAPAAGTLTTPAIDLTSGALLTTPIAGGIEYDGVNLYATIDTTSGRGMIPVIQYDHLTAVGTAITTVNNFFGANSNISLVPSAYYEIEILMFFLKNASSTITWTLLNSAAPTSQNIIFEMSPVSGIVAPPGGTASLGGQVYNNTAASYSFTTGSLTNNSNQYARFRIYLANGAGTSLQIRVAATSGSLTPGINSYWFAKRLSPAGVGTFAA